ncbi:MAG: large-conductance mechanosensitive channel protein MscL [Clostridiales bacterium]|nr:large-conductance mechanosensitive channel protein MscL [Clostridiales bacterium]
MSFIKKFASEFREFAVKGSVIDLAVGVMIGGAFSKIVSSFVNDVATPFIGMFLGGVDFKDWVIHLPRLFGQEEPIDLNIGVFVNTVIEFFILALIVFLFVKLINRLKRISKKDEEKKEEPKPPEPTKEELLLAEIRDILKERQG